MRVNSYFINAALIAVVSALSLGITQDCFAAGKRQTEAYIQVPMPEGFRVEATEFDGPVFADQNGRTLYRWAFKGLRVGNTGDPEGQSNCTDIKTTENTGYMSPYPGGFTLPDLEERPSCVQKWPPVKAAADAKPVGKWTIIARKDGISQWAYDGAALYTSVLDHQPGDVIGGDSYEHRGDFPALRQPVGPPPDLPPGFSVSTTPAGRLLQTDRNFSVYASDQDRPNKSNCDAVCVQTWSPMLAPETARPRGEWSIVERAPGYKQWAFRKRPLYRYNLDKRARGMLGSDVPGWHNVYTQLAPPPPAEFTVQDTPSGQVLADHRGMTIYGYSCGDDSLDQRKGLVGLFEGKSACGS